jgi:hypothetical protein
MQEITALKQLILPRGGMRCMARFGEFVWIGAEMMVHAYHHKVLFLAVPDGTPSDLSHRRLRGNTSGKRTTRK